MMPAWIVWVVVSRGLVAFAWAFFTGHPGNPDLPTLRKNLSPENIA
jgi:hypothetical protein